MPCNYQPSRPIIESYLNERFRIQFLNNLQPSQLNTMYDALIWSPPTPHESTEEQRNKRNLLAWIARNMPRLRHPSLPMKTKALLDESMQLRLQLSGCVSMDPCPAASPNPIVASSAHLLPQSSLTPGPALESSKGPSNDSPPRTPARAPNDAFSPARRHDSVINLAEVHRDLKTDAVNMASMPSPALTDAPPARQQPARASKARAPLIEDDSDSEDEDALFGPPQHHQSTIDPLLDSCPSSPTTPTPMPPAHLAASNTDSRAADQAFSSLPTYEPTDPSHKPSATTYPATISNKLESTNPLVESLLSSLSANFANLHAQCKAQSFPAAIGTLADMMALVVLVKSNVPASGSL